jgi:formylmethanofuran dehydrogenase subunit B
MTCPLDCPDACGVLVETDEQGTFLGLRGNPEHPWSRGSLCGKTAIFGDIVTSEARLKRPLVRGIDGRLEETSWENALAEIARRVAPLRPGETLALCYAGCMGQIARKYPLRVMNALGAVGTDGGICDNTATEGWRCVMGHVVGGDLQDIEDADLLLLWGVDVRRTHQHVGSRVQALLARGVPVWTIDIYRTDTIRALEKLGGRSPVLSPGTDAMLALALTRLAYESGRADREYLRRECTGAEEFERHVRAGHELAAAASVTGLTAESIRELALALSRSKRPFVKTGVGFTRRRNGGGSMRAVCSLAAVLGAADRLHYESSEHFGLATGVIERADLRPPGTPAQPIRHVELGRELETGRFRAAFVWGHNPAVTVPDSRRVRAGLSRDDLFLVVHELFLTETAELADVVLPSTAFVEQSDVFRSYGHRVLHYTRRAVRPPAETRSNVDAFRAIARKLDLPREVWDVDEESLCHELLEASRSRFTTTSTRESSRGPVALGLVVFRIAAPRAARSSSGANRRGGSENPRWRPGFPTTVRAAPARGSSWRRRRSRRTTRPTAIRAATCYARVRHVATCTRSTPRSSGSSKERACACRTSKARSACQRAFPRTSRGGWCVWTACRARRTSPKGSASTGSFPARSATSAREACCTARASRSRSPADLRRAIPQVLFSSVEEDLMLCRRCGTDIPDGSRSCAVCGDAQVPRGESERIQAPSAAVFDFVDQFHADRTSGAARRSYYLARFPATKGRRARYLARRQRTRKSLPAPSAPSPSTPGGGCLRLSASASSSRATPQEVRGGAAEWARSSQSATRSCVAISP